MTKTMCERCRCKKCLEQRKFDEEMFRIQIRAIINDAIIKVMRDKKPIHKLYKRKMINKKEVKKE